MSKVFRRELWLTNVIKDLDKPLKAYINIDSRGKHTISEEGWEYINELGEELRKLKPNVVLATGNVPLLALTNRLGITKWRGSVLESTLVQGLKVVPTFHPATFIPPKFNFLNRPLICEDILLAKRESEFPELRRLPRSIITRPSFKESCDALSYCYEVGLRGQTISIDIEVINKELDCISFGWSPTDAISIPFRDHRGDYFSLDQEHEIMLLIAKIIQEDRINKVGANFIFDMQFLFHKYGIEPRGDLHCTQIAQKISFPDFPAGLAAVTTMYTDIPYYKEDGKQWMKMGAGSWEEWWNYNGMDSIVPVEALPKQLRTLANQQNEETYHRQRKLIKPLIYMSERGIKVDVEGMLNYKTEQESELAILEDRIKVVVGRDINTSSPQQLMQYFYKDLNHPPYRKRNANGKYTDTIDVDALKRLARKSDYKGSEAAQLMLDIRSLSKRISTYLNIGKVDTDGRMRSSYKPVGADTGRLSSGETIFGTGCMPPDAECLTKSGWKPMYKLYDNPEEIIQWSKDGTLSWSDVKMNCYSYTGNMIEAHSSTHKAMYTPDHRIPSLSKRGNLSDVVASKAQHKSNWFLPISGNFSEGFLNIPAIELLAMTQADGSIEGNGIRFTFSKQRKIDRFLYLMNKYSIKFTEQSSKPNSRRFYISVEDSKIIVSLLMSSGTKLFGSWLLLLTNDCMSKLLEEIKYWDSYIRGDSFIYYTVIKQNADWVATLAHLCNKSATITKVKNNTSDNSFGDPSFIYNVNVKPRLKTYQHESMYTERYYNWNVYCPTVESSYFLCRYKDTIFVTGNSNQQNWPHDLLRFFKFDKGYLGYSIDLSQIENRIVAYVGGVLSQIEAFEKGIDLHRLTASVIFGKPYDEISGEDGSSSLGDGRQSERYWGKKGNHATNYDVGYRTFALKNEMREVDAKYILESIHQGYPQIRGGYHLIIQDMLRQNRMVTNLFGRNRLFLGPVVPSYPFVPKSACLDTYRKAYAHLAQSTCADKINEQGLEYIYYNQDLFKHVELLAQVHDSVVFQIPLSVPWIEHAKILMLIKNSLETPLIWHDREIKTPADIAIGLDMCKEHMTELKHSKFPSSLEQLADKIEEIYNAISKTQL